MQRDLLRDTVAALVGLEFADSGACILQCGGVDPDHAAGCDFPKLLLRAKESGVPHDVE